MYSRPSWFVEGRVVYWDHEGLVPIEDVADANDILVAQYLRSVTVPPYVHVIVDLTRIGGRQSFDMEQLKRATSFLKEPTLGWVAFVSDDMMKRFFATVVTQLARVRFRSFKSFEEACDFLNQVDATLPDLRSLPRPTSVEQR